MKKLEMALLFAGLVMLAVLIKQMDMGLVMSSISAVGAGFIVIFFQELVAQILNSLGWKYSITPQTAKQIPFSVIYKMRVAGDGVNYLTPSATLAGEWARAVMMGPHHPLASRLSSVAIAKITQTLAMVIMSAIGIAWALNSKMNFSALETQLKGGGWLLLAIVAIIVILEIRAAKTKKAEAKNEEKKLTVWQHLKSVDREIMGFIRQYPGRFAISTLCFFSAFLWGAVEVYWICSFLGFKLTWSMAVLIEMLSVFLDGLFFAVPGKAGTQETTKTALFACLGLPSTLGFSFAVVRHLREILWAVIGFGLYYQHRITAQRAVLKNKPANENI